jgi:ADP-dependent NAD(P)H-hydrate dehydratase / NAD(P)H-hydrate epimerase
MKILTSAEMREVDRRAIEEIGIPGVVLMENAGIRTAAAIADVYPECDGGEVLIAAGKGNNGGDGFVIARQLAVEGWRPRILLFAGKDEIRGDAAVNLAVAVRMGLPIEEIRTVADIKRAARRLQEAPLIVDALFGTGLAKPLEGFYAEAVAAINRSPAPVVAVDIPSGLSSDTFEIIGPCVEADLTVCLAAPKIAHVFPPAEDCVGKLRIVDIGMPPALLDDPAHRLELFDIEGLLPFFDRRKPDTHKGTYGHLLIVAGSRGKTGAAVLAGKAALKSGAGLVTVAVPESCLPIVARASSELMTEALPETPKGTIVREALHVVRNLLKGKNALVLGPGLSTDPSTAEFVRHLLPEIKIPFIIDADGLNIIASHRKVLDDLQAPCILTPHPGEFSRLTGLSIPDVLARRLELAPGFSRTHGLHLVLKGYRTLVADPEGRIFVNPSGNPGMATGGTGDVLAGMIAAFLMPKAALTSAVTAAVFAHGMSGDLAAESVSQRALTAGDIIRFLPRTLRELEGD